MRWFVSYCYDDERENCEQLRSWASENQLGEGVVVLIENEDKRIEGENSIKKLLKDYLNESDGLIVLVGDNCHNRPWMDYETDVAISKKLPILTIRVPNTNGAAPELLRKHPLITYEPNAIKNEILKHKK
jgi:hypothetical protein